MKFFFTGKEWFVILVLGPLIIFLLAMIDVPFRYWMFGTILFPEWLLNSSILDLISMSGMTMLVGAILGAMILIGYKLWK